MHPSDMHPSRAQITAGDIPELGICIIPVCQITSQPGMSVITTSKEKLFGPPFFWAGHQTPLVELTALPQTSFILAVLGWDRDQTALKFSLIASDSLVLKLLLEFRFF